MNDHLDPRSSLSNSVLTQQKIPNNPRQGVLVLFIGQVLLEREVQDLI